MLLLTISGGAECSGLFAIINFNVISIKRFTRVLLIIVLLFISEVEASTHFFYFPNLTT